MSRAGPVSRAASMCRDDFQPGILHEASQPGCDEPWETGASLILYSHWLNEPGWPGKHDYMEKSQPS